MVIIKSIQREAFPEEIALLSSADTRQGPPDCNSFRVVKKTNPLCKLDPFLDENGLLIVGGQSSTFPIITKRKNAKDEELPLIRSDHQDFGLLV